MEAPGWYSRGYLPHFDGGTVPQPVTFSLYDCYPWHLIEQWREEWRDVPAPEAEMMRRMRIEQYLDKGHEKAWLRQSFLADLVQNAMLFHDGGRYHLHAWVVMPTHAHALLTPKEQYSLSQILHSWKSYTSNKANAFLHREGPFWIHESYDRFIRDEQHYWNVVKYIENNPLNARLCLRPEEWRWSSAYTRTARI